MPKNTELEITDAKNDWLTFHGGIVRIRGIAYRTEYGK